MFKPHAATSSAAKFNGVLSVIAARRHDKTLHVIPRKNRMPNSGAKISSAYITAQAMRDFIAQLPSVMREIYGNRNLTVSYGWSCNLHWDLLYKPMNVPLEVFPYFIEDSVEQRIFEICGSDLLIASPDSTVQILLCHESDIHLDGPDDEALARIVASCPEIDFRTADQWEAHYKANATPSDSAG